MQNGNGFEIDLKTQFAIKKYKIVLGYNKFMGLYMNGIGIGKNPNEFNRNSTYQHYFNKIGKSKENILLINNFMPNDVCNQLIEIVNKINKPKDLAFWDEMMYFDKDLSEIIFPYINKIKKQIELFYDVLVKPNYRIHVNKWTVGKSLGLHVDDLSEYSTINHIATLIYLNDNYEGGEIYFPEYNNLIKPNIGDLIIFPGNLNYVHEVKSIINGNRYTIPTWFRFA